MKMALRIWTSDMRVTVKVNGGEARWYTAKWRTSWSVDGDRHVWWPGPIAGAILGDMGQEQTLSAVTTAIRAKGWTVGEWTITPSPAWGTYTTAEASITKV